MMGRSAAIACFVVLGVPGFAPVLAARPARVGQLPARIDIEFHDPQRITLRLPGDTRDSTFWYLLYKVTNNTGNDVQFFPSFRLVTNTLAVREGGAFISPSVYGAISARHKREYPFFTLPDKVTGLLLQGAENARSSAAIFLPFDPQADSFTIYISGLSDEIHRVSNPAFDAGREESQDNPRSFILRRTLAIVYDLPGDPRTRSFAKPIRRTRKWTLR